VLGAGESDGRRSRGVGVLLMRKRGRQGALIWRFLFFGCIGLGPPIFGFGHGIVFDSCVGHDRNGRVWIECIHQPQQHQQRIPLPRSTRDHPAPSPCSLHYPPHTSQQPSKSNPTRRTRLASPCTPYVSTNGGVGLTSGPAFFLSESDYVVSRRSHDKFIATFYPSARQATNVQKPSAGRA
jgi:hypothetical protein